MEMTNKSVKTAETKKINIKLSAKDFMSTIFCFVFSKVKLLTYMSPLSVSFYAATFSGSGWYYSLCACIFGIMSARGDATSFRYILTLIAATPLFAIVKKPKVVYRAFIMSFCYFCVCTLLMLSGGFLIYDYIFVALESFIIFVLVYLLRDVTQLLSQYRQKEYFTSKETVSVVLLVSLVVISSSLVPDIFGLNVASMVAIFVICCVSLNSDCKTAAAIGVVMGVSVALTGQESVSVIGAYAFCAFMSALLKKYSRLGVVLGFTLGNTIITAFFNDSLYLLVNAVDVLVSGLVFATLPPKTIAIFTNITQKVISRPKPEELSIAQMEMEKEQQISQSLKQLSDIYKKDCVQKSLGKKYMNHIFNMCVERVCSGCNLKYACWRNATYRNYELMTEMLRYVNKNGKLDLNGLPERLSKRCVKKEQLIVGFNFCYDIYKTDKIWLEKMYRIRGLMSKQLMEISSCLDTRFINAPSPYCVKSYTIQKSKESDQPCGDTICEMELSGGNYAVVLSDGMGSGNSANIESSKTVELFKNMLSIGFDIKVIIEIINSTLFLKSDKESFSTIDALYLNCKENTLSMAKVTAAPTYVVSEENIKKYECNNLPVGILKDVSITNYRFNISDKTVVVMISDGISNTMLDELSDSDWICDLLQSEYICSPKQLGETIMENAIAKNGGKVTDDMTVHIAIIEKTN